jgi:hypothetical protein
VVTGQMPVPMSCIPVITFYFAIVSTQLEDELDDLVRQDRSIDQLDVHHDVVLAGRQRRFNSSAFRSGRGLPIC